MSNLQFVPDGTLGNIYTVEEIGTKCYNDDFGTELL